MKRLLAVDESQLALEIMSDILSDEFEVVTARNDLEMNKVLAKDSIDIIVINTIFRTISGVKVIYRMRKSGKGFANVPVMFVSSHIDQETITEISAITCADLVKKPFEPLSLCKRIEQLLNRCAAPEDRVDLVTGLHKRSYIDGVIADNIRNSVPGTMFIMDFDNYSFASNNVSQNCLKQIGEILRRELKENVECGLMSGSAVMGYIKGETDKERLVAWARDIIGKITSSVTGEKVYVSVGLAALGRNGDNYADLYLSCDKALNLARTSGKNCAFFYC